MPTQARRRASRYSTSEAEAPTDAVPDAGEVDGPVIEEPVAEAEPEPAEEPEPTVAEEAPQTPNLASAGTELADTATRAFRDHLKRFLLALFDVRDVMGAFREMLQGRTADAFDVAARKGMPQYSPAGPRNGAVVPSNGQVGVVIQKLNPILNGWCAYFRVGNSNRTFYKVDWAIRRESQL